VGFGGGAALVGQIGQSVMAASNGSPFAAFRILGGAFTLLILCTGLVMEFPPDFRLHSSVRMSLRSVVIQRQFIILYLAMSAGLAAGLAVNANLKEMLRTDGVSAGVSAVSVFAIANAAGRLSWGALCDRVRPSRALIGNLVSQAVVVAAGIWMVHDIRGFLLFSALAGFNYGGVLVIYASTVAQVWGKERVGQIYGAMFSSNILGAGAPLLAGVLFDATGGFEVAFAALVVVLIGAALAIGSGIAGLDGEFAAQRDPVSSKAGSR
jgi:MFS transporter, OFA family, oxalate/formate antiporter